MESVSTRLLPVVSFVDDNVLTRIKNHDSSVLVTYWICCFIDDGDDDGVATIIACDMVSIAVLVVELVEPSLSFVLWALSYTSKIRSSLDTYEYLTL